VLRRDPLTRVLVRSRAVGPGQLLVGAIDSGDPLLVDCDRHPHHQVIGATGSGKSTFLHGLQAAIAPTDAALVFWDLKFGLEAEAWRARYTEIATTQPDVLASAERVLTLAEQRAGALKQLGVRNIAEAAELGVHFRRVFVLVDWPDGEALSRWCDMGSCVVSGCAGGGW
jgi:DNA segregation ATPase FtsK/SpoIIIE-like protein